VATSRGKPVARTCSHLGQIAVTSTEQNVCAECVQLGDSWVHLRLCLVCGHVGCCDSSRNRHATRHYQHTAHPLVRSMEPGERWVWCYADETVAGVLAK
jgi:uncharacterized UBP type Zn finger protein